MQNLLEEGVEVLDAKGRRGTPKCSMDIQIWGKGAILRWDETFRKTLNEQAQLVEKEHIQTKSAERRLLRFRLQICESQPVIKDKHKLWHV